MMRKRLWFAGEGTLLRLGAIGFILITQSGCRIAAIILQAWAIEGCLAAGGSPGDCNNWFGDVAEGAPHDREDCRECEEHVPEPESHFGPAIPPPEYVDSQQSQPTPELSGPPPLPRILGGPPPTPLQPPPPPQPGAPQASTSTNCTLPDNANLPECTNTNRENKTPRQP